MSNSIEQAIDLIKKFALAAQEKKAGHLAQLTLVETYMSVQEQCQYAFTLAATLQETSIEAVKKQFGFSPTQLEYKPFSERQKLITTGKNALIFKFMGDAMKNSARAVLQQLGGQDIDPSDRALLTALAMTTKPPKPGALLN